MSYKHVRASREQGACEPAEQKEHVSQQSKEHVSQQGKENVSRARSRARSMWASREQET